MSKFTKIATLLAMLMLSVACSKPEDYNPTIDSPNVNNGSNDNSDTDKKKVTIVGSWLADMKISGYDFKCQFSFKQNNSGQMHYYHPQWHNDNFAYVTDTYDITYSYNYELGVLRLSNMPLYPGGEGEDKLDGVELSAVIVSHNDTDVLHISGGSGLIPYDMSVFRRVQ